MVSDEQVTAERRAIAEGCRAHLAGTSLSDIAKTWNQAGLRTPRGNRWTFDAVRNTLARATNAGLIEYDGVVVGRMPGDPIVDEDTLQQVRAAIASRRRGRVAGQTGHKYIGSGILRCGECGHTLSARIQLANKTLRKARRLYFCPSHRYGCGKVVAPVHAVDPELRALVIARLSDPAHAAQVTEFTSKRAQRLTEVRTEIEHTEQLQEALAERLGREEIKLPAFDKANRPLAKKLADLVEERESLETGAMGPLTAATAEETALEWDTLADAGDVEGQRVMLRRALGQHQLIIDRAPTRGPRFNPARLRLRKPDGAP